MKLTDKERDGKIILMDGAKYVSIAAASALLALLVSGDKKSGEKGKAKFRKKLSKRYKSINGIVTGASEKVALKWLEKDVAANPDKYLKRDKGIHIESSEMIDI